MKTLASIALLAAVLAGPASAGAPQPTKLVPLSLYSGRWHEIARTPNPNERGCKSGTSDFSGLSGKAFLLVETCQKPRGAKVTRAKASLVPGTKNAKFRMSLLGGLVHPEFWILDTAPTGDWAIMATPGGHYVWLMSRSPKLPETEKAAALARIAALGFPTGNLEQN